MEVHSHPERQFGDKIQKKRISSFQFEQIQLEIYIYIIFVLPEAIVLNFRLFVQEIVSVYPSPAWDKNQETEEYKIVNFNVYV